VPTSTRKENLPSIDMRQGNSQGTSRILDMLQCRYKRITQPFEKISIDLALKSKNKALVPLTPCPQIDTDAVDRDGALSVRRRMVSLEFQDEKTASTRIAPPEARTHGSRSNPADIEVSRGKRDIIPW